MTGKMRVWPVKSTIRPDIVRWPAVIFSPVKIDNNPIFIETIGLVKEFPL